MHTPNLTQLIFWWLTLGLILTIHSNGFSQPQQPNILFIYTDDQAPWALGVSGNPQALTPHLDQLAREGAYLPNSFVTTPVCSPARASLMTSQYASEYGILDFIPQPGHKLYNPDEVVGLPPESITFAEVLSRAGYVNGLIGKWHLGDWTATNDKRYHPLNHGFHYFMGLTGGGTTPEHPTLEKEGVVQTVEGLTTDILTDHALAFIRDNAARPFMLSLHYRAPHGAWLPVADEDWASYQDMDIQLPDPDYPDLDVERVKRMMREYLASTSGVDRNVGRLLKQLDALQLTDNTIVIFTSDHGYNMGHHGITHKGNGIWVTRTDHPATDNIAENSRPNLYDNSLKVPTLVRWPGVIKPGTLIEETVSSLDWYPTIVEMAATQIPAGKIIRGKSIVPLLKGEAVENWDNDFYAEYSMINYSKAYMRAYRTPTWKLMRDFLNPGRDELYNLAEDPEEKINRIDDTGEEIRQVIHSLDQKIIEHMKVIQDPLLEKINH